MKFLKFIILVVISMTFFSACKNETTPTPVTNTNNQTGNPSIDNITQKLRNNPNDVSLYVSRAQAYRRMGAYDEAIMDINRAIKMDSTHHEYYLFLGDVLLDYNRSKDAIRVINSAVHRFPDNIKCLLKQAEIYHILKQYHQSTSALNAVLLRDPENARAYFLFGRNFSELLDTTRAIQSFQKAVDKNPDILDGWISLGNLWSEKGPVLAEKYYQTAVNIDSSNVYALNSYALFLGNQDRFQESIDIYKKIALLDPQFSDAFFNSGIIHLTIDSIKQANQQFNLAIKTNPTFAKAYYYRGLTFAKLGNLGAAKNDYEQSLIFDPNYTKAADALNLLK